MNNRTTFTIFFVLVFAGVGLRLLCRDIPNFAPVAAISLYAGFFFSSMWLAVLIPISVLTVTNFYLGGYDSWIVMLSVYSCLVLPALFGRRLLKRNPNKGLQVASILGLTFSGSLLFFFVTNYASWLSWYPKTIGGFVECYVAAIPFFRYTLMGDFFFCFVFFGAHAVAVRMSTQSQPKFLPVQA